MDIKVYVNHKNRSHVKENIQEKRRSDICKIERNNFDPSKNQTDRVWVGYMKLVTRPIAIWVQKWINHHSTHNSITQTQPNPSHSI